VSTPSKSNLVAILLICAGVVGVFGPHLVILGAKAAGVRPPAALSYFCPLHRVGAR
jgi:hypothetical protein